MVTIVNQSEITDLRRELAALSREAGISTDRRLVIINNGAAMFPDGRFVATFAYDGHYRWTRVSFPGETRDDFYRRVMAEAHQRGGVLTVAGGLPPEPRDDDCDPAWTVV
jgi:hypothetical protein